MAFIELVTDATTTQSMTELFDAERQNRGYVPNYVRLFAHRPAVFRAWGELLGAIKANMDPRRYELVTIAAAQKLRSSYCMLAHGQVLVEQFLSPSVLRNVVRNRRSAGLDDVDVAVMDLAEKVAEDAAAITRLDIEPLLELGLSEDEIFDVVLAAAARSFFTKANDALGVEPDGVYAELEPELQEALTVGRSIASA